MDNPRILIQQLGRFGDLILLTPTFKILKEKFPNVELTLLAGRHNFEVVLGNPYIDVILKYDKSPHKIITTLYKILTKKYDYWIDPRDHFSKESRILATIANAKHKIGYNFKDYNNIFDISLQLPESNHHYSLLGINSLKFLGINTPTNPIKPDLYFIENEQFSKNTHEIIQNNKYILLNLSASNQNKMWKHNKWIEFLQTDYFKDKIIVINYMKNDEESAKEIKNKITNTILHQPTNIRDVMAVVFHSELVITPDTSIVHIASGFDKPLFALYSGLDHFYHYFEPTTTKYAVARPTKDIEDINLIETKNAIEIFKNFINKI